MPDLEEYDEFNPNVIADKMAELKKLTDEANDILAEGVDPGSALAVTGTNLPAAEMKSVMAAKRSEVVKKRAEIERLSREIEASLKDQMHQMMEAVRPMQEMVRRLEEGIWTVNLYLGRDETIETLREGEHAPAETPITIRQMVLGMDQETMAAAEEGGIDAYDIATFDEWILADPAHLEQVLPETKGVVVLVPRLTHKDYGDFGTQMAMNAANAHSYWLIRNGDALYRMDTDLEVGKHLVPTRDEFTSYFRKTVRNWDTREEEVVELQPGSRDYLDAEKNASERQRHYMRIALVLQGLMDRTPIFHPLPAPTVNLMQPESYDAGHVQIITDADMALSTGREPFYDWLARLNAQLRVGMRVVGNFQGYEWHTNFRDEGGERVSPRGASGLKSGELYTLEKKTTYMGEPAFVFKFKRTDKHWKRQWIETKPGWGYHGERETEYQKRASATILTTDRFIIPFDLVTIEEMEAYIDARLERHAFVAMIPLLKAAIAAKKEEQEAEAPFRLMLAGIIQSATGDNIEDINAKLPDLVDWWKLANRWHRPLVGDEANLSKAVRMIPDEYKRRVEAEKTGITAAAQEQAMAEYLLRQVPDAMVIARKRDGSYIALEPAEEDGRIWAHRTTCSATGRNMKRDEWLIVRGQYLKWRILHQTEAWDEWDFAATEAENLSGPERERIIEELLAASPDGWHSLGIIEDTGYSPDFKLWTYERLNIAAVTPKNLLTGTMPWRFRTLAVVLTWKRTQGGKLETTVHVGHPSTSNWRISESVPWYTNDTHHLVWSNPDELAVAAKISAEYKEVQRLIKNLTVQAEQARASIRQQWTAAHEAEAYARFLEDYADPDLWEGHKKTLKLPEWKYFSYRSYSDDRPHPFELLTNSLIERGIPIAGHTVREALSMYNSVVGRDLEIGEDILDYAFPVQVAEVTDDDEDWD